MRPFWTYFAISLGVGSLLALVFFGLPKPMQDVARFSKKARLLAETIRTNEALSSLEPWAIEEMRKIKLGKMRKPHEYRNNLYWTETSFLLPESETPDFIRRCLSKTNGTEVLPEISIVFDPRDEPVYVLLNWYDFGAVIGPSIFPFEANGTNQVRRGVYTYSLVKL